MHVRPAPADMILNEVDLEEDVPAEVQEKRPDQSPAQPSDPDLKSPSGPNSCPVQEDAETQTGRWTPFIESIKREAEDIAVATMEER